MRLTPYVADVMRISWSEAARQISCDRQTLINLRSGRHCPSERLSARVEAWSRGMVTRRDLIDEYMEARGRPSGGRAPPRSVTGMDEPSPCLIALLDDWLAQVPDEPDSDLDRQMRDLEAARHSARPLFRWPSR